MSRSEISVTRKQHPVQYKATIASVILLSLMVALPQRSFGAQGQSQRIEASFKPIDIESVYVRRATWQDTLHASIEKLRTDYPTFSLGRCELNDRWFRNGPHDVPTGKREADVDFGVPLTGVDLGAKTDSGVRVWEYKGPVRVGEPYDLTLPASSSVFQCRQFKSQFAGLMDMYLGSEVPLIVWLNGEKIYEMDRGRTNLWKPRLLTLKIQKGRNEMMIRFDNETKPKTTRFYIAFNNITTSWNGFVERLQQKVAQDFTSPRDVFQQSADFDNRIWITPWSLGDVAASSRELAMRYANAFADRNLRGVLGGAAREAKDSSDIWAVRSAYYNFRWLRSLESQVDFAALRRAIADRVKTAGEKNCPEAKTYLSRIDRLEREITSLVDANIGTHDLLGVTSKEVMATKPMTDEG
jgi:hypothetical protein